MIAFLISILAVIFFIFSFLNFDLRTKLANSKDLNKAYDDLVLAQKNENNARILHTDTLKAQILSYSNLIEAQAKLIIATQKEMLLYKEIVENISHEQTPNSKLN
jgi:hypothetical protein